LSSQEILELSVGDLAAKFGCSRRHLNRLFHDHFGVSVAALKMEMRLLKAASLLRGPDAKVINVAEQCGFNHLGLFNTCFKRRFGTSPGQWRKTTTPVMSASAEPAGTNPACRMLANGLCPWTNTCVGGDSMSRKAPNTLPARPGSAPTAIKGSTECDLGQAAAFPKNIRGGAGSQDALQS
jgi:AraC-like DNA-binding protein